METEDAITCESCPEIIDNGFFLCEDCEEDYYEQLQEDSDEDQERVNNVKSSQGKTPNGTH